MAANTITIVTVVVATETMVAYSFACVITAQAIAVAIADAAGMAGTTVATAITATIATTVTTTVPTPFAATVAAVATRMVALAGICGGVVGFGQAGHFLSTFLGVRSTDHRAQGDAHALGDLAPAHALAALPQHPAECGRELGGRRVGDALLGQRGFGQPEGDVDIAVAQLAGAGRQAGRGLRRIRAMGVGLQRDQAAGAQAIDQRLGIFGRAGKAGVAGGQLAGCDGGAGRGMGDQGSAA